MSIRRSVFWPLLVVVLAAISAPLFAQRAESPSSRLFPTVDRVFADFPDVAQRAAALSVLLDASMERLPGGAYKASYEKSSSYQLNMGLIEEQMGKTPAQAKEFQGRMRALQRDQNFRRQVLNRYGLADLPTGTAKPQPAGPSGPQPNEPVVRKSGEQLFKEATPYYLATILLMYFVARQVARSGGNTSVSTRSQGGDLPSSLQVVEVLGRRYPVELESGVVIQEKTWTETTQGSTYTPGQVLTVNDQTIQLAGQTHQYTSTVRKDVIWIKTADGLETPWNFSGGQFETRVSHVLSRIGRAVGNDVTFLMVCNHTTAQIVTFDAGISAQHGGPFLRPWVAATLVGTAGFLFSSWSMLPILNEEESFMWRVIGLGVFGLIGSTVMGFLMAFWLGGRTIIGRNKEFHKNWEPKYREFLKQHTPVVLSRFRKSEEK